MLRAAPKGFQHVTCHTVCFLGRHCPLEMAVDWIACTLHRSLTDWFEHIEHIHILYYRATYVLSTQYSIWSVL